MKQKEIKGTSIMKIMNNFFIVWTILVIGLLPVQISEAAISNAIDLGNIMTEISLVSDQTNSRPGKYRVDGTWPETITIDYNPKYSFKKIRIPEAIDLGDINKDGLDRCLLAIANEPNLMERIDQRRNTNSNDEYYNILSQGLDNARKFIPYDVNNPTIFSDVNKPENLTVSLCLIESKVYFWNSLDDRDVIGWGSVWSDIGGIPKWKEPKLTVWIIPRLDKNTSFISKWNEYVEYKDIDSEKTLVKLALDIDIEDANSVEEQVFGKIKEGNNKHSVKILRRGNILQSEITFFNNISISGNAKFRVREVNVLAYPLALPFPWPPKTEDNENTPPN